MISDLGLFLFFKISCSLVQTFLLVIHNKHHLNYCAYLYFAPCYHCKGACLYLSLCVIITQLPPQIVGTQLSLYNCLNPLTTYSNPTLHTWTTTANNTESKLQCFIKQSATWAKTCKRICSTGFLT